MKQGLFVAKLDTKGPAFHSGIRYGDIITAVEDVEVNSMLTLREELYKKQKGDKITLEIVRDGNMRKITVLLSD